MELLYVWAVNFNNIKEEGFVFSNQFNFISTLENSNLKITVVDKENYIKDFFGAGIYNVTAIIGENGSGKSSLIDLVRLIISNNFHVFPQFIVAFKINETINFYSSLDQYNYKIENKSKTALFGEIIDLDKFKINHFENVQKIEGLFKCRTVFYSPIFDLKNFHNNQVSPYTTEIDISTNNLLYDDINEHEEYAFDNINSIEIHRYRSTIRYFELLKSELVNTNIINFPKNTEILLKRSNFSSNSRDVSYEGLEIYNLLVSKVDEQFDVVNNKLYYNVGRDRFRSENYDKGIIEKYRVEFYYCLIQNFFFNLEIRKALNNEAIKVRSNDISGENLFECTLDFFNKQQWISSQSAISLLEKADLLFGMFPSDAKAYDHGVLILNNNDSYDLLQAYQVYLSSLSDKLDYKPNRKQVVGFIEFNWRDLSSGEKGFLDLFSRLLFSRNKIEDNLQYDNNLESLQFTDISCIYIICDEGEVGFHPQWQKEFIWNLLSFIKECFKNVKVQLLLSSHSPFLVSDLPKNNLIFLSKGPQNQCVVSALSDHNETFGGNIHTLYTDAFFLKDGLLGKFAMTKIQEEMEPLVHNKVLSPVDRVRMQSLVNIIGEPILKKKLQEMLNKLPESA